jgi:hypothetical protein
MEATISKMVLKYNEGLGCHYQTSYEEEWMKFPTNQDAKDKIADIWGKSVMRHLKAMLANNPLHGIAGVKIELTDKTWYIYKIKFE